MRTPTPSLAALIALAAACSGDITPPAVDTLHISPASAHLWVGETVQLSAEIRRPDGSVRPAKFEWSSSTPAVEVSASGLVQAAARGSGVVRASGGGLTGEIPVASLPVIHGRVHAAGGGSVSGLLASWRGAGASNADAVAVGSDGAFEIRASTVDRTGELRIDGDAPRAFHPFLFPFDVDELGDADVVLVPRTWTVQSGIYAGQTVDTHLDLAMDDDASRSYYSYFFGQPEPFAAPTHYLVRLRSWPLDHFPAQVAFDHRHGSPALTAQDSADIWAVLDGMETVFGIDLFQPVEADPTWWPDEIGPSDPFSVPGVIRIVYGPPKWGGKFYGEAEPLVWEQELGTWASGGRFTAFQVSHQFLDSGTLLVGALEPLQLADGLIPWETVLVHEMLHVLGVGHTCRIPSPQGPCMRTAAPSPQDIAYMELLRETMRLEREHETFLGIMPATIGERRVLLQLPALPDLWGR